MARYLSGRGSGWSEKACASMPMRVHGDFEISSIVHCISPDIITTAFGQRPLGPFADVKSRRMFQLPVTQSLRGYRCTVKGCQLHATYNTCARAFVVRSAGGFTLHNTLFTGTWNPLHSGARCGSTHQ